MWPLNLPNPKKWQTEDFPASLNGAGLVQTLAEEAGLTAKGGRASPGGKASSSSLQQRHPFFIYSRAIRTWSVRSERAGTLLLSLQATALGQKHDTHSQDRL